MPRVLQSAMRKSGRSGLDQEVNRSAPLAFTLDDLRREFLPQYLARGVTYANQGRVAGLRVSVGGGLIEATVRGSDHYGVQIELTRTKDGRVRFDGFCDCPLARNCKHVAATLLTALQTARAANETAEAVDPRIGYWLMHLHEIAYGIPDDALTERTAYVFAEKPRSAYVRTFPALTILVAKRAPDGTWRKLRETNAESLAAANARSVLPKDSIIGRSLIAYERGGNHRSTLAEEIVRNIVATGHAYYEGINATALSLGPARRATIAWTLIADGSQRPEIVFDEPHLRKLPGPLPWYVDLETDVVGPAETGLPLAVAFSLLEAPPIAASQAAHVGNAFAHSMPTLALPKPLQVVERVECVPPVPRLLIRTERSDSNEVRRWEPGETSYETTVAELTFGYGSAVIDPAALDLRVRVTDGASSTIYERNPILEDAVLQRVASFGFTQTSWGRFPGKSSSRLYFFTATSQQDWIAFVHESVPQLRAQGWQIEIDPSIPWRVIDVSGDAAWHPTVREAGSDWFDLALGVDVEGKRVDLLPMIAQLFTGGGTIPTHVQTYYASIPGTDLKVAFPAKRLQTIVSTLVELTAGEALQGGALRLPRIRAGIIDELEAASGLRCDAPARLRTLSERLRSFAGIKRVAVPKGFRGKLRPYQRDGLDWLQFLASYGFGGILADDMGLGKSVQTLAHLMREKEAGRLTKPALLVVPTSLVVNWCDEAARFTPKLRVLALHGAARAERFAEIAEHDLVITTYALLIRDAILSERSWHAVILDEAQALKNPQSKGAQAAMALKAEHRLCLTGTPVENHLGDLWSILSIAMPGLLGERKQFTALFRTPIEKHGNQERNALLGRRTAPFLLRRTKEAVAADLPEKSEIVQRVELLGAQRDLYETVRLAMHRRVREEIETRGLARSQIVILDALLKLRQVCCDPRLLPNKPRKVVESAKLEMLLDMIVPMVEEGRRILLFSQFTSMLDLIAPALTQRSISFVTLTGKTLDRATVVKRFQAGDVPVFLISLRAGGTGLNLTRADTVIHYDPWWNPAVERQATDRAHRIGQTQHVFAYKLICAGTVEEKIVALQARKSELASAIFAQKATTATRFSNEDVEQLLAPMA